MKHMQAWLFLWDLFVSPRSGLNTLVMVLGVAMSSPLVHADAVDFNRDILPLLSDRCFKCHGPDPASREADLQLDRREEATRARESGIVIQPGRPNESLLLQRIESLDLETRMPPPDTHLTLTPIEIQRLRQWIQEGAVYTRHWSWLPPTAQDIPQEAVAASEQANPIDALVRSRLDREGLHPSSKADKATLLRRASLALTGLPPTIDEQEEFLHDTASDAYERVIDRLLASPHFGERMALDWLDAARYADTNGYYNDTERQAWPWRDWLIQAFNRNLPYDQFTIEQLAGDLLPNPTLDQQIASGFNRNHMVTNETGIIDEEYRLGYVADRLDTTGTVWLGLTVGCARCHDHKYDPISQRDYYRLFAAFNNVDETGIIKDMAPLSPAPSILLPTAEQEAKLAAIAKDKEVAEAIYKKMRPSMVEAMAAWESIAAHSIDAIPVAECAVHFDFDVDRKNHGQRPVEETETGQFVATPGVKGKSIALDATQYIEFSDPTALERDRPFSLSVWIMPGSAPQGCVASKMDSNAEARGFEILWYKSQPRINLAHRYGSNGIEVVANQKFSGKQWRHLAITYDGSSKAAGVKIYVDGVLNPAHVRRDNLSGSIASSEPWRIAWKGTGIGFEGNVDEVRLYARELSPEEVYALHWRDFLDGTIAIPPSERTRQQSDKLENFYVAMHGSEDLQQAYGKVSALRATEEAVRKEILSVSVMQDMEQARKTHVLLRGQYDNLGDEVEFGVPASLGGLPESAPRNRLGLAQWLISKDNPLTARVAVNRLWSQCFGDGLVRTPNDFGVQGEPPSHPELLDWLAVRFRDGDATVRPWDMKAMLKLIVMSSTFQQTSNFTPELLASDPDNMWLARGPRFRLAAETLRDQALAIGGLLSTRLGGPSVKPSQPPGLWEAVSYNGDATYVADEGEARYWRGIYSYWKRQSPPPAILTFDGPTREVCSVRRSRTNTPLQALLMLNDETYLEAARGLATRMMHRQDTPLAYGFQLATGRKPSDQQTQILEAYFREQLQVFQNDREAAARLVRVGASPVDPSLESCALAAWTMTANIMLNLDEVLTQH